MNKEFYYGSICLSDIPADSIKVATNGKKYLSIVVVEMIEQDHFENTHAINVSISKEERTNGVKPILLGKIKKYSK